MTKVDKRRGGRGVGVKRPGDVNKERSLTNKSMVLFDYVTFLMVYKHIQ